MDALVLKQQCTKSCHCWTLTVTALYQCAKTNYSLQVEQENNACMPNAGGRGLKWCFLSLTWINVHIPWCALIVTAHRKPLFSHTIWNYQGFWTSPFFCFFVCDMWLFTSSTGLVNQSPPRRCPPVVTEDNTKVQIGVWQSIGSCLFLLGCFQRRVHSCLLGLLSSAPSPLLCFLRGLLKSKCWHNSSHSEQPRLTEDVHWD